MTVFRINRSDARYMRYLDRTMDNKLHFGQAKLCWNVSPNDLASAVEDKLSLDLDLGAYLFNANVELIETINFMHKQSICGAIVFDGDSHAKEEKKEGVMQETISFDLGIVSKEVDFILFFANIYSEHTFAVFQEVHFSIKNLANNTMLINQHLALNSDTASCVLATLAYQAKKRDWDVRWVEAYNIAKTQYQLLNSAKQQIFLHKSALPLYAKEKGSEKVSLPSRDEFFTSS